MNDFGGATSASVPPVPESASFAPDGLATVDHLTDDGSGLGATHRRGGLRAAAVLGVLGVVYGDIGTSPLYALKASLQHFTDNGSFGPFEVLGILSLIFWSLVLIVTVKYVLLVMRADNRGEGGILALMALAQRSAVGRHFRRVLLTIGIVGACLFFGDGVITPAISVLSAVEGLEVSSPQLARYVLPVSAVIIVLLFALQWRGTSKVGMVFGPVMVVWFAAIGLLGAIEVAQNPAVLNALSPVHGIALCAHYKVLAFVALGSIVLAVTGAEALYADMGHFGALPIRAAWLAFVLPCAGAELLRPGRAGAGQAGARSATRST